MSTLTLTDPLGLPAVAPVKLDLSPPNWEARSDTRTPVQFVRTFHEWLVWCVCGFKWSVWVMGAYVM